MVEKAEVVLEAATIEYQTLRDETIKRIGGQATAFAAAVALVGAFVGVLFQFNTSRDPSVHLSMLQAILRKSPDREVLGVFAVLAGGFTLGVELLMSFWAYQLHMMFRISHYLSQREELLQAQLQIADEKASLFSWTSGNHVFSELWDECPRRVEIGIKLATVLQPAMLIGLALLGLVLIGATIPAVWTSTLSGSAKFAIVGGFVVLLLGWLIILHSLVAHHERLGMDIRGAIKSKALQTWKAFAHAFDLQE